MFDILTFLRLLAFDASARRRYCDFLGVGVVRMLGHNLPPRWWGGGCGGVSLSTLAVGAAGSASIASRTYPVSSLSAFVNLSCGTPETTVVWSRYVSTCGGRDAAVPALATIAASSTTMSRWLSHPSVYSVAGLWLKNEFETTSARPSWSTGRI